MTSLVLILLGMIVGSALVILADKYGWLKDFLPGYKDFVSDKYENWNKDKPDIIADTEPTPGQFPSSTESSTGEYVNTESSANTN